jgi:CRP/FNR family transcriptional regulator, cyclic AMP receptor protein
VCNHDHNSGGELRSPDYAWPPGSLLGSLAAPERAELLRLGVRCEYPPGRVLLREGERSTHVVLLLDACVKVTAATEDGHTALLAIRWTGTSWASFPASTTSPGLPP